MAVKVEVNCTSLPTDYPKLKKSRVTDCVVLFESFGKGAVVMDEGAYGVGHYHDAWAMDLFEDFQGSITLSNG